MTRLLTCSILLAAVLSARPVPAADLTLAADGKTTYAIVIDPSAVLPPDADGKPVVSPAQHAANELASFLKQVTGAEFRILITADLPQGPQLVVGKGKVQQLLAPDLKLDELKTDGIVIETKGQNIIFAGTEPRGVLYAVYTFLEDAVGCRWWSSKASTIPHRPDLTVPEQHVRYSPPLEYRESFWYDAFDADWSVRNRHNGEATKLDARRGGKITYAGASFVHTFDALVPPKEFAQGHPEYFSERDGKRIVADTPYCQLCVTNPDVKRLVTERVLGWLAANPDASIVSVSQNDADRHCLCPTCKKLEDEEGSPAGPLLYLVNHVAAEVAKQYPKVAVDTLAYQYTRKPPLHVKPLPNVIIRLCTIECDFATPLTSDSNKTFAADLIGWGKICDRVYIWDYVTDFSHYLIPFPNQRVLTPNLKFFVDHGTRGVFEEGAYQSHGAEMAELKAWVLAQAMWDPTQDNQELIEEFLAGYFGPAAQPIGHYLTLLHDSVEKSNTYLNIGVPPSSAYLTLDLMTKAEKLFSEAEALVKDSPDLLNRVQVARLPIRYVWSCRWQDFQLQARKRQLPWPGPADFKANAETFMALCKANDVRMLSEGAGIDSFQARMVDLGRIDSPPPPGCENTPQADWIDYQDAGFTLWQEGTASALKHDDLASDKVAAWMPGTHFEWAIQQTLAGPELDPNATYDVYASVRVEKAGNEGGAFTAGLYDAKSRVGLGQTGAACQDLTTDKYVTYKIDSTKLHEQIYVWVAPVKNPQNVKSVWVDRVWIAKQQR